MSVFRYRPPSVGFAQLSSAVNDLASGPVPAPTIGSSTVSPSSIPGAAISSIFTGDGISKHWTLLPALGTIILGALI